MFAYVDEKCRRFSKKKSLKVCLFENSFNYFQGDTNLENSSYKKSVDDLF